MLAPALDRHAPRGDYERWALGAAPAQVLRTVTLPALRPALVAATSVVYLFCATSFGVRTIHTPNFSFQRSSTPMPYSVGNPALNC